MSCSNCPSVPLIASALAVVSIGIAIVIRRCKHEDSRLFWGYILVGSWTLLPPLWFIWEWHAYDLVHCEREFEHFKYSQELARNVWVALVVFLGSIVRIKWSGSE
jgi:hypothetical protein